MSYILMLFFHNYNVHMEFVNLFENILILEIITLSKE